jgi:hypothetical protein
MLSLFWSVSNEWYIPHVHPKSGYKSQSKSMLFATAGMIRSYLDNESFDFLNSAGGSGKLHASYGGITFFDFWKRPFDIIRGEDNRSLLLVSYGSDGRAGGVGSRADWIYEIKTTDDGLLCVTILKCPIPEFAKNQLEIELGDFQLKSKMHRIKVSIQTDQSAMFLDKYAFGKEADGAELRNGHMKLFGERGNGVCRSLTLIAIGWVGVNWVIKRKDRYLYWIIPLLVPLIILGDWTTAYVLWALSIMTFITLVCQSEWFIFFALVSIVLILGIALSFFI